ncbi:hypothetical protein SGLAM104S_08028 [Streptomyces glaucescens]
MAPGTGSGSGASARTRELASVAVGVRGVIDTCAYPLDDSAPTGAGVTKRGPTGRRRTRGRSLACHGAARGQRRAQRGPTDPGSGAPGDHPHRLYPNQAARSLVIAARARSRWCSPRRARPSPRVSSPTRSSGAWSTERWACCASGPSSRCPVRRAFGAGPTQVVQYLRQGAADGALVVSLDANDPLPGMLVAAGVPTVLFGLQPGANGRHRARGGGGHPRGELEAEVRRRARQPEQDRPGGE